mmetsp:Transcript_104234/g.336155  ORF Transcript_104234/g.336155 Transcript_104234/m.336155 type:complete len:260 (-) Transcript_104234:99-878(-)
MGVADGDSPRLCRPQDARSRRAGRQRRARSGRCSTRRASPHQAPTASPACQSLAAPTAPTAERGSCQQEGGARELAARLPRGPTALPWGAEERPGTVHSSGGATGDAVSAAGRRATWADDWDDVAAAAARALLARINVKAAHAISAGLPEHTRAPKFPRPALCPPSSFSALRSRRCRVRFDFASCTTHEVTPYSEIYGLHPREFVFDRDSYLIPAHGSFGFVGLPMGDDDADEECEEGGKESEAEGSAGEHVEVRWCSV